MVKSYVLDASALIFYLETKPAGHKVVELLKEAAHGRAQILMSPVNCGEAYGKVVREMGHERAAAVMNSLQPLPIRFVDVTKQRAFQAAELKIKHKLYFADSFAAALAKEHKAILVTSDSDFRRLGHDCPILWLKA